MDIKKKQQTMRYDEIELSLIKNTFAENYDLLKTMRKVFLQLPLNKTDLALISMTFTGNEELKNIIKKMYNPELKGDEPLNQIVDLWLTVPIKELTPDIAYGHILAREIVINYLKQQIETLFGNKWNEAPDQDQIVLADLLRPEQHDPEATFVNVFARNTIVNHVEQQLSQLLTLAGQKNNTPDSNAKRLKKDSLR